MSAYIYFGFACLAFSLSACGPTLPNGHYEGNFFWQRSDQKIHNPVRIDVSSSDKKTLSFKLSDITDHPVYDFEISRLTAERLSFKINSEQNEFILSELNLLETLPGTKCIIGKSEFDFQFCYSADRFSLHVEKADKTFLLGVNGSHFSNIQDVVLESPTKLTLREALERSYHANLRSQIGFQKVLQAKEIARAATLNLLPRINLNIFAAAQADLKTPTVAARALPILLPFLVPSNWQQITESRILTRIEEDTFRILQADIGVTVEELCYNFERDLKIKRVYEQSPTSRNELALVELLVKEDQYALSQALGFLNPEAVEEIQIDDTLDLSQPLDKKTIALRAVQVSLERQQLEFLIDLAKSKKSLLNFSWLDPNTGFGFNFGSLKQISTYEIEDLYLKRSELINKIYYNTYHLTDLLNYTLKKFGEPTPNQIELYTNVATLRSVRAKISRLLLTGNYERLLDPIDSPI